MLRKNNILAREGMSRVGKVGQLDGMLFVEKKEEVPSSGTNSLTSTIKSTISLQSFLPLLFPTHNV